MDGLPHRGVEHAEVSTVQGSGSHMFEMITRETMEWVSSQRGGAC